MPNVITVSKANLKVNNDNNIQNKKMRNENNVNDRSLDSIKRNGSSLNNNNKRITKRIIR